MYTIRRCGMTEGRREEKRKKERQLEKDINEIKKQKQKKDPGKKSR